MLELERKDEVRVVKKKNQYMGETHIYPAVIYRKDDGTFIREEFFGHYLIANKKNELKKIVKLLKSAMNKPIITLE